MLDKIRSVYIQFTNVLFLLWNLSIFMVKMLFDKKNAASYFCDMLIALGPVYIKLGQNLADQTPELYPLKCLQDNIPYTKKDADAMKPILDNLDPNIKLLSRNPLANASVATVFKAICCGETIIVKILKPGIRETFYLNRNLYIYVGKLLGLYFNSTIYEQYVRSWVKTIEVQLDFRNEYNSWFKYYGLNVYNKDDTKLIIPKMFKDLCTTDIIVMEYRKGVAVCDMNTLEKRQMAELLLDHFWYTIIYNRMVHSDLHAGNIALERETNKLILYDFGYVAAFDENQYYYINKFLCFIYTRSYDDAIEIQKMYYDPKSFPTNNKILKKFHDDTYDLMIDQIDNRYTLGQVLQKNEDLAKKYNLILLDDYFQIKLTYVAIAGAMTALKNKHLLFKPNRIIHRYILKGITSDTTELLRNIMYKSGASIFHQIYQTVSN